MLLAVLAVVVKLCLFALESMILLFPDLPQFVGKGMLIRFFGFLILSLAIPVMWLVRGRGSPYPAVPDVLFTLPFVLDLAGNALGLYVTQWQWFDKLVHFLSVLSFGVFFLCVFLAFTNNRWLAGFSAVGVVSFFHIGWELMEYVGQQLEPQINLGVTFTDTLGDLSVGLVASLLLFVLVFVVSRFARQCSEPIRVFFRG